MIALLALLLAAAEGRPLFYWGAREPVIVAGQAAELPDEARVVELHAVIDEDALVLRFTLDRPVRDALYLPDGRPVSGRLRAVLYIDADDDRATGLDQGPRDLRSGAERRLEVGVVSLGEDPEEKRPAAPLVTATLVSLTRDGRRRTVWRRDAADAPDEVSAHGEWVELRIPLARADVRLGSRLVLAAGEKSWDGRLGR